MEIDGNEQPDSIIRHPDSEKIDKFFDDTDAPTYKNESLHVIKRKQEAVKAVSYVVQNSKFGGDQEEDWDQHVSDYEAIVLDYQLRSKDLAYYMRLTLCDQALAVHRAEYPKHNKTYQ